MSPKTFVSCYICGRDFGLQSINFHEPKCLSKWRAENSALPPENQCPTPIKLNDEDSISNDSVWTCVRCYNIFPAVKRNEHVATCSLPLPKIERPKTRTLNRLNGTNGLMMPRGSSSRLLRPQTKTLNRPTPNLEHPIIEGAGLEGNEGKQKQVTMIPVPTNNPDIGKKDDKGKAGVGPFPPPCKSCHRNDGPERFHSHHRSNCPVNKKLISPQSEIQKSKAGQDTRSGSKIEENSKTVENGKKVKDHIENKSNSKDPNEVTKPNRKTDSDDHKNQSIKQAIMMKQQELKKCSDSNDSKSLQVPLKGKTRKEEKLSPVRAPIRSLTELEVAKKPESEDESLNSQKRPRTVRTVVCYLCGREFGTRSYPFHEPHCIERWRRDNQALPPELRRPMPQRPTSGEGFSELAWETFQAQLIPCPSCGRTFFPNRLPIHQKACKGPDKGGSPTTLPHVKEPEPEAERRPTQFKPVLMTCYICARQFGSMSLALHEPQCLKKWRQGNEKRPIYMQRPEPEKPSQIFKDDGTLDTLAMEEAAWKSHIVQLSRCNKCGRTFFPDRLAIHEPNCKAVPVESTKLQKITVVT